MKTDKVDLKLLKNIVSSKKYPYVWICGKDYVKKLIDIVTKEYTYDSWGRRLYNIPLVVVEDHPRLKNSEIVLFNEIELKYALDMDRKTLEQYVTEETW